MEVDRNGLEVLGGDECLRMLETVCVGRLGLTSGALPTVLPVNYRMVGNQVVFRTSSGSKLAAAARNAVVAFEADDLDPVSRTGWSVLVVGVAREVPEDGALAEQADVDRWAPGHGDRLVAVSTDVVSGRRLRPDGQPSRLGEESWS